MSTKKRHGPATKCRHAATYKALRPPRCGCDICAIKWELAEVYRVISKDREASERRWY